MLISSFMFSTVLLSGGGFLLGMAGWSPSGLVPDRVLVDFCQALVLRW